MKPASLILLAWLLPCASQAAATPADLLAQVNAIRADGCDGRRGVISPLRPDARLDRAAQALAAGRSLDDAMADAGYPAWQTAMLEATGADEAIARALARRGCRDIADPVYRDIGLAVRTGGAWIVLAAPLAVPAAADAPAVARRVLELVNQARSQPRRCGFRRFDAAPALARSEALHSIALAHARDMAARGVLTHAGQDGSTPAERVTRAGYRWRFTGENIAAGQPTPEQVVAGWLASPRHCANIMDPDFTEMGVGYAVEPASAKGIYWTQVLAVPRG